MYVCLCNGITDRDVKSAIQSGANSVSRVYRSHDCKAQCGKCTCQIKDMIRGHQAHHSKQ
ncbi:bacterioferritin-associated ferredoxin [Temperatibacter marinus]|uniref:bacterioferritin-associated ferredoxin n=1 Tax=Temperatibacter marinus TaxID=1456591 RepID=UPI0035C73F5A